jgi:hypothetical protein
MLRHYRTPAASLKHPEGRREDKGASHKEDVAVFAISADTVFVKAPANSHERGAAIILRCEER